MEDTVRLEWHTFGSSLAAREPAAQVPDEKYQHLRAALVRFLEHHGSPAPEDHAQEAICRLLQNQSAGVAVNNPSAYAYQIARHVMSEDRRESGRRAEIAAEWTRVSADVSCPAADPDIYYRQCLQSLPPSERSLIKRYYQEHGSMKADVHERMAAELGTTLNNLRVRIHRIRQKLQAHVDSRMQGQDTRTHSRGQA